MPNKPMNKTVLPKQSDQRGFTLLEVLVAVVILAVTGVAILQQFSAAQRAGIASRDSTRAVLHAKEKLEELKIKKELSESTESGTFDDGYEWETEILAYTYGDSEDEEEYEKLKHETYQLRTVVSWQFGDRKKQVELSTLRTVKKREWN